MSILSSKNSLKNKPAHNFSQKISQPTSTVIVCSSDLVEFISSLWGLGILLQYYAKPIIILPDRQWQEYIKRLYPECDYSVATLTEFMMNKDISSFELIILLTCNLAKDVRSALNKIPNAVIAGTSDFRDIHVLNCIISVNELQSPYYQYFSFATQLTGILEDWESYTEKFKFITDESIIPEKMGMICIDISNGIFDAQFSKKLIYELVNGLQKSFPIEIILIDSDRDYYSKLSDKKFKKKPELLIIDDYCKSVEILKSTRLLIASNTPFVHCMQYTSVPTFCIIASHERRYLSKRSKNHIHIVQRFSGLKAKNILPDIKEILK